MNILMLTNTFTPHVGGVARSVESFSRQLRKMGHRLMVVAPTFEGDPENEPDVIRIPALHHFHQSDFSFPIHFPGRIRRNLRTFQPDIIHAHHPFLLGDTALRIAAVRNLPILFTHHTMYERYTHYLPGGNTELIQRFVVNLVTGYCNLCDAVIAPSSSVHDLLRKRNVTVPIEVIPTGIDIDHFSPGDGSMVRRKLGISDDTFVIGHIGRLAKEKNLEFLTGSVLTYLAENPRACFVIAGQGPEREPITRAFGHQGLSDRLHLLDALSPVELAQTYRAMDVFVFASQTETQGLVLLEAMASGTPVVAVKGPGVSDIVTDGRNGRLLNEMNTQNFADAIAWIAGRKDSSLSTEARAAATALSITNTTERLSNLYEQTRREYQLHNEANGDHRSTVKLFFSEQGKILANLWHAAEASYHHIPKGGSNGA